MIRLSPSHVFIHLNDWKCVSCVFIYVIMKHWWCWLTCLKWFTVAPYILKAQYLPQIWIVFVSVWILMVYFPQENEMTNLFFLLACTLVWQSPLSWNYTHEHISYQHSTQVIAGSWSCHVYSNMLLTHSKTLNISLSTYRSFWVCVSKHYASSI